MKSYKGMTKEELLEALDDKLQKEYNEVEKIILTEKEDGLILREDSSWQLLLFQYIIKVFEDLTEKDNLTKNDIINLLHSKSLYHEIANYYMDNCWDSNYKIVSEGIFKIASDNEGDFYTRQFPSIFKKNS